MVAARLMSEQSGGITLLKKKNYSVGRTFIPSVIVDVFETDRKHLVLHMKPFLLLPARRSAPHTNK